MGCSAHGARRARLRRRTHRGAFRQLTRARPIARPGETAPRVNADELRITGAPGAILRGLLSDPARGHPREPLALGALELYRDGVSPAEADRLRNVFDQHKASLNRRLVEQRIRVEGAPQEPLVFMKAKLVFLRWDPTRDRLDHGRSSSARPDAAPSR